MWENGEIIRLLRLKEFLVSYKDLINILSSEQIEYVDVYHDKFHILTNDGCYFSFKLK